MIQVRNIKGAPLAGGHVVQLEWENPSNVNFKEVVVHRRADSFGLDPSSLFSVEIYRGTGTKIYDYHLTEQAVTSIDDIPDVGSLSDNEKAKLLKGEKTYYYTIYTVDTSNNYHASRESTIALIPAKEYKIGNWLYEQLPLIYRREDKKGELQRFCELLGKQLDLLYSIMKGSHFNLDLLEVNPKVLNLIAKMLGWKMDNTLATITKRRILQNVVNIYKLSGTKLGLTTLVKYYSGFPETSGIWEGQEKIIRTPYFSPSGSMRYYDYTTPDFATLDPGLIGTANDPLYYTWDFRPGAKTSSNSYTAYVQKTSDLTVEEEEEMRARLEKVLKEFTPIGVTFNIDIY